MKDQRFYLEFPTSTAKKKSGKANVGHAGNVFALDLPIERGQLFGSGAVTDEPNGPIAGTGVSRDWLRLKTKRIPESLARTIHPRLFSWLDSFTEGTK